MATYEMDLQMCEALAPPPHDLIQSFSLADEQDLDGLTVLIARYESIKAGKSSNRVMITKEKKEDVMEDKENFLMPAPKVPLRSGVRKRKTKLTNEELILPRNSRITRSSRMTGVLPEDVGMPEKPVRSRATRSTQVLSPDSGTNETSILCESDSSMTGESKKSRRGTKKVKETPPRASRRGTRVRASSRIGAPASTRASTRASSRAVVKVSVQPASPTRTGKASYVVDSDQYLLKSPGDPQPSKKSVRQKSLFSPYSQSSVKKRVQAFEGLSSKEAKEMGEKLTVQKGMVIDGSHENEDEGRASPVIIEEKALIRVKSPVVKGNKKLSFNKFEVSLIEEVFIKEEVDEDTSAMEVEENDAMVEELLKTSNVDEEIGSDKLSRGGGNDCTYNLSANEEKKGDENEADDEWMTDDEEKTSGSKKKGISDNYCTPKQKSSSASKLAQEVLGSYKALRSRKVNKGTSEVSLALSGKGKVTPVICKSTLNLAAQSTKAETEIKEAELKRQQEKEKEAIRRKEELLKKRTESTKKKREEKMSKVKRTREEREKELEAKKVKKAKQPAKKKKMKEAEVEVVDKKTPEPVASPVCENLNSTYTKPEVEDAYNMTPHWAEVSPKQPINKNDYGVVDKSDCSSEEENDPRKKIPSWTKEIRSHLLCQSFFPVSVMHEFWQTKPRALNIGELFGNKVSKNTLKRGLHYRTSSAIWHTPPLRK